MQEDSLTIDGTLPATARAGLIERALVSSLDEAISAGQSLAIIRPEAGSFSLSWKKKTPLRINRERLASHARLLQQTMFDRQPKPLEPCPYEFRASFADSNARYDRKCGDWETEAMFWNLTRSMSEGEALNRMTDVFNQTYPRDGMALALGNMRRNPSVWMLLGIIRVDQTQQPSLL
ncbi:MAG: hypothetical protein AB7J28_00145 [Hyphomonadaceae bacterium]